MSKRGPRAGHKVKLSLSREVLACISALSIFTDCDGGTNAFLVEAIETSIAEDFERRTGYKAAELWSLVQMGMSIPEFVKKAREEHEQRSAMLNLIASEAQVYKSEVRR
jgi:hypothetical protein